ncbi:MAG: hypothetical protein RL158_1258 [Bacteroidota bacterium]|jgi:hypothetical protein
MTLFTTILLAIHLAPNTKDTLPPTFNKYTMGVSLKVPTNYYTKTTGFFCNTERAIQKQTKVAVKFRLGSVEQTQRLEGYNLSTLPSSH